jgi:hypothetical protein
MLRGDLTRTKQEYITNTSALKEGFMKDRLIDAMLDIAELASLAAFVAMIGLVAHAYGA